MVSTVVTSLSTGAAVAAPAMAAIGSTASRNSMPCSCRSTGPFSEFLGAEVHASAVSPVFQQERASIRRPPIQPRRSQRFVVRSLFGLGVPELAVIAGVAAILFGPKKLPEIGKSLGKTVKSFQQAAKEFESEIKNPTAEASGTENTNVEKPSATPLSTPTSTSSTGSDKEPV